MATMNEGCINCGREETYNGCDNPDIRYLCALCVVAGIVKRDHDTFLEVETTQRSMRKPKLRLRRTKVKKKEVKTLATC